MARPLSFDEAKQKVVDAIKNERAREMVVANGRKATEALRNGLKANQPLQSVLAQAGNLKAEKAEPFVLAVGKDLARDYATLAEALRPLRVRAVIACLPRNVRDVRLPANVEARLVDPVELRTLYARASCVVVPQRRVDYPFGSEGGGLTALLEAMASARPTVVSDRPLLREYGEEGVTTLFVPPEEPEALAASIASLNRPTFINAIPRACQPSKKLGSSSTH